MRNVIAFLVAVFLIPLATWSLSGQVAPINVNNPELQRRREEAELSRRMRDLHTLEQRLRVATQKPPKVPVEPKLSSEERERVHRLRQVSDLDLAKYDGFLRQEKTGIFKLFPELGCISKSVIRVSRDCAKFVPMSSSFTFRRNGYGDEIYHDVNFKDGRLSSKSFFSQGIFVAIGDEPVEGIGVGHSALNYLTSYQPDIDPKQAAAHAEQFRTGIDAYGFRYADAIDPKEDTTYAMRMIAYRLGSNLKPLTLESTMNEMMFHSLAFDKRVDVIIAFRILGRDDHGGLTIVWKELARNDAAKIKFTKNQTLRDFRPNSK